MSQLVFGTRPSVHHQLICSQALTEIYSAHTHTHQHTKTLQLFAVFSISVVHFSHFLVCGISFFSHLTPLFPMKHEDFYKKLLENILNFIWARYTQTPSHPVTSTPERYVHDASSPIKRKRE